MFLIYVAPSDDEMEKDNYKFEEFQERLGKSLGLETEFGENYKNKHVSLSLSLPGEQVDPFDDDIDTGYLSNNISSAHGSQLSSGQGSKLVSPAQVSGNLLSPKQANSNAVSPTQESEDLIPSIYGSDNIYEAQLQNQQMEQSMPLNEQQQNQQVEQPVLLDEQQQNQQMEQSMPLDDQQQPLSLETSNKNVDNNGNLFYPSVVEESILVGQGNNDSISSEAK